jgi:structural maintenance of chromosome 4
MVWIRLTSLQPGGGHEAVPDSALIISRKAFRNNGSKYYINSQESNFTSVTNLLRSRGVDLDHKRFLILQGEVESIAQMKPKAANEHDDGLLEYLEDIIGTSKYKSPIEESALEVETLNEMCVEKSSRVQHVEKEKNSLEDKKNKALAFIRDENELTLKQSALYQVYVDECGDNIKITEEALSQMQTQLNEELGKHQGSEDEIKELQKKFKHDTKEYETLERETQSVVKEMTRFDKENVKFEEKRKFLAGKRKKLEKTLQSSRLAASESASMIEKYSDDIERNGDQVAKIEKSLHVEESELASIRNSLKGKTQVFSDQIAAKQKSLEPWNARINEKQSAIAVAQSELDIFHEKSNAGAVALEEIQAKIRSIEEVRDAKLGELEECKAEKIRLKEESCKLQTELDKVRDREPEIRSQLSGARQKAEEARASLANTQTQGNVLTGLIRLKESGRIEGFHGRLGSLGTIDQRYDVAISTACPSLDNIVVDSVEIGQQCINYLRKNNLGRAIFILLDRLPQRDMSEIDTPEGVPRLFDLVKPKHERFRSAFYSVMQNTLVATDLAQANRIAYGAKRWRVVTEDGQLIDKSGTMSGGGTRVTKGAMSSKLVAETSKEQVSKLEIDRDAMENKFQDFQKRRRELENDLKRLNDQLPLFDVKMQKMHLEIESLRRNLADAQRRMKELSGEHLPLRLDDSRVAALRRKIGESQKELENLHAETVGVEEEIRLLQDKIMEVGGVKLRSQKAKVDGLKDQIDTLNEEISSAEVAKAKAEKQKEKHEKTYAESANELESLTKESEELDIECRTQATVASRSRQRAEEAKEVSNKFRSKECRLSK